MQIRSGTFLNTVSLMIGGAALCLSLPAQAQGQILMQEQDAVVSPAGEGEILEGLIPEAIPEDGVSGKVFLVPKDEQEAPVFEEPASASNVMEPRPGNLSSAPTEDNLVSPSSEDFVVTPMPSTASEDSEFDDDLFFDSEDLVPTGELARKGVASKLNPSLEPGSRFVISSQTHGENSKDARLVAADRALKLGRYEAALSMYDDLYASNKRDPNILMGRAVALQHLGRDEEAVQGYEALLTLRPKNVEAQINMHGLLSKRYPAVALRNLMDLHQDNPGDTQIVAQLAVVSAQMGQYSDAIRYLGMAASMEPGNAGHVYNMAVIADRAGDKKAAVKYYEEALDVDTLYGGGRTIPREAVFERLAELR